MIFSVTRTAKVELERALKNISRQAGYQYDAHVMAADADAQPKKDVELTLEPVDFDRRDEQQIPYDEYDLRFQINVMVSRGIPDEANRPIDEIALDVLADVERAVMQDYRQNGSAVNTSIEGATVVNEPDSNYYGWALLVSLHVRYAEGDQFNPQ